MCDLSFQLQDVFGQQSNFTLGKKYLFETFAKFKCHKMCQGCLGVWKVLPVCVGLPIFATLLSVAESLLAGSRAATFFMDLINAIEVSVQPEVACDSVLQDRGKYHSIPWALQFLS